jgi:hypothetical protein
VLFQGFNEAVDILFGVKVMRGYSRLSMPHIDLDTAFFQNFSSPLLLGDVGIYKNITKVFTDESGRPAGIFVDLIEDIAPVRGG